MAVSSKISVDVDSSAFTEFAAAFAKYEAALKDLPGVWAGVEKSTAKTRTNFEATAISVGALSGSMAALTKHSTEFFHVTTSTARHWRDLALSTKSAAINIKNMTKSILRWWDSSRS